MDIENLKAGMILDSIYNSCLSKDSEFKTSRILKYVGKDIVVFTFKKDGKELYATRNDILTWNDYKIR